MPCSACQQKNRAEQVSPSANLSSNKTCYTCTRREPRNNDFMLTYQFRKRANANTNASRMSASSSGGTVAIARKLSKTNLASTNWSTRTSSEDLRASSLDAGGGKCTEKSGSAGSAESAGSAMASKVGNGESESRNTSFDPRDYAQGKNSMSGDADKAMVGFITPFTEKNFESSIGKDTSFVKFFVPWCGHCQRLAPIWEQLAYKAESATVKIAEVDCSKYGKLCDQNRVDGYPTLILFKNGKRVQEYPGKRTVSELLAFVQKHAS